MAFAVKQATQTTPIIMANAFDPVLSGLVASLARPGGNITGFTTTPGPEIHGVTNRTPKRQPYPISVD